MRKLLRAGCLCAVAALAACQGDGSTQTSSDQSSNHSAVTAAQPITLTTDSTGLVSQTTAKGTIVQLEGRFQSAVVARRNADGSISTSCHDEQAGAEAFMQGATAGQAGSK